MGLPDTVCKRGIFFTLTVHVTIFNSNFVLLICVGEAKTGFQASCSSSLTVKQTGNIQCMRSTFRAKLLHYKLKSVVAGITT